MKRISLVLNVINSNNLVIEYYLNHEISSFVYSLINDIELHDIKCANKFCFSNIIFKNNTSNNGLHIHESKAHLLISSDLPNVISSIIKNVDYNKIYKVSNILFKVVKIYEDNNINLNLPSKFKTFSPIVIEKFGGGEISLIDNPSFFISELKKTILNKIGRVADINIIIDNSTIINRGVRFKGGYIEGYLFNFEIQSEYDVILKSYYNGFGNKNAMGFGFVKQIK